MVGREKLTAKQESFCLNYFKTNDGTASAIAAGYSPPSAKVIACENLTKPYLLIRINDLRAQAKATAGDAVMSVVERQKRLTEFASARLVDFITNGEPNQDLTSCPNNGALSEIVHKTRYTKAGDPIVERSIKLRDPIAAIAELNKMDHTYDERPQVNNNTQINIIVDSERGREIVQKLIGGR